MTVLQNPDKSIIKSIQSIFYDFLWDSKPDEIARNLIIQDYPDGGLHKGRHWILYAWFDSNMGKTLKIFHYFPITVT